VASNLHLDFRWLHPTAWVYWQVLDIEGWGLITADLGAHSIKHPSLKYFVLAQYSRHIRPGMTIIESGDLNAICALDRARGLLVVVAVSYDQSVTFVCDLGKFSRVPDQQAFFWQTTSETPYARNQLNVTNQRFVITVPPKSVQTFEIHGVTA